MKIFIRLHRAFLLVDLNSNRGLKEEDGKCKAALVLDALLIELLVVDDMVASCYQCVNALCC
jgi:hypothetical protein